MSSDLKKQVDAILAPIGWTTEGLKRVMEAVRLHECPETLTDDAEAAYTAGFQACEAEEIEGVDELVAERDLLAAQVTSTGGELLKLEKTLAELREWLCEGEDCEHTLADVEAHDANHPKPTSGGCWFCLACWNKAIEAAWAATAEAQAERDAALAVCEEIAGPDMFPAVMVAAAMKEAKRLQKIEKLAEELVDSICEFGKDSTAWGERLDALANELVPE